MGVSGRIHSYSPSHQHVSGESPVCREKWRVVHFHDCWSVTPWPQVCGFLSCLFGVSGLDVRTLTSRGKDLSISYACQR